jgi:hypothetical protein
MELDLKFVPRGDEIVLVHDGKTVGMYMPTGDGEFRAATLPPAAITIEFVDEKHAMAWLVGTHLQRLATSHSSIAVFK